MKIISYLLILSSVLAEDDVTRVPLTDEDKGFWDRLLQVDGLSTPLPPNSSPISEPVLSPPPLSLPIPPLPTFPVVVAVPVGKGGMSKSKKGGMGSGNVIPIIPTASPQERPNGGNSSSLPGFGNNSMVTNTSFIPICKRDALGRYLQYNDPQYNSPDSEIVFSTLTTFQSSDRDIQVAIRAFTGIQSGAGGFGAGGAAVGAVAGVISATLSILTIFGIGGVSAGSAMLMEVRNGFRVINDRLTDIQLQIRQELLQIRAFIGDIALDDLASNLDATMRKFSDFVNATNETIMYYDRSLREYCNNPFQSPQDIFYNLYGYACSNCTFAPRKRANITQVYLDLNSISRSNFLTTFGNFILLSMFNALFLHSVCLPPIEGSCLDRSTDMVWQNRTNEMSAAFNESMAVITNLADSRGDWVNLLQESQLREFFPDGADNQQAANNVSAFLDRELPDFYTQVLVANLGPDFMDPSIWRRGCSKTTSCSTTRTDTGHIWFEINGKSLSIRYRLKSLPPAATTILLDNGNISIPFPDFYASRVNVLDSNSAVIDTIRKAPEDCFFTFEFAYEYRELRIGFQMQLFIVPRDFPACVVATCFLCSDTEIAAFNVVLASQSLYIWDIGFNNVQRATNNETVFGVVEFTISRLASGENTFIFYYN